MVGLSDSPVDIIKVIKVLENSNTTGMIGNISIVPNSITFATDLPALTDIRVEIKYSGFFGDTLEISCNISGPFLPIFQWEKDDTVLSFSSRVKIENDNQGSRLFVRKTGKSDSGEYYCIVSKGEDRIEASVSVNVKVIPVVKVSPLFVSASEGDAITLECEVTQGDDSSVKITWFSSEESGVINETRKLDLSKTQLSGGQRYTAK
ncbi:obscurin-like protein 1 [Dendronephthya gigantea]|uniref:obscurin-like protein 1 n=1 Tax=Dendronephthya gigantea TaxID=151771 RepID=UPI00106ACF56|nr:obscurin-like protein 1 [Dendronephthya gigantea]